MTNSQLERHIAGTYSPDVGSADCVQGAVQQVDTVGREITVLLSDGIAVFDVPPDCPIFLHGERIKLRMVQPRDQAKITFAKSRDARIALRLEVQPDSGYSCFLL
jgi:hypothetical protein